MVGPPAGDGRGYDEPDLRENPAYIPRAATPPETTLGFGSGCQRSEGRESADESLVLSKSRATIGSHLLVVSHPCVIAENQEVYLALLQQGWSLTVVTPALWRDP